MAATDDMTECPIPFAEVVNDKTELMLRGMHGVAVDTESMIHEGSEQILLSKNKASWKQQVAEMAQRFIDG